MLLVFYYRSGGRDGKHDGLGSLRNGAPINRDFCRSWDVRFEDSVQEPRREKGMPPFDQAEKDAVSVMLRSMLSFKPEGRPTAKQVLKSEWIVKWALPEFEKVWSTDRQVSVDVD